MFVFSIDQKSYKICVQTIFNVLKINNRKKLICYFLKIGYKNTNTCSRIFFFNPVLNRFFNRNGTFCSFIGFA